MRASRLSPVRQDRTKRKMSAYSSDLERFVERTTQIIIAGLDPHFAEHRYWTIERTEGRRMLKTLRWLLITLALAGSISAQTPTATVHDYLSEVRIFPSGSPDFAKIATGLGVDATLPTLGPGASLIVAVAVNRLLSKMQKRAELPQSDIAFAGVRP